MFDNSKLELFPNQFVNAHLILETLHDQIIVSGAAVLNGAQGSYVYLVNADNTVSMRPVVVGPSAGEVVSITKGLESGQTVVVDGADQLRDGAKIMLPQAPGRAAGASSGGTHARRAGGASSGGAGASSGSSGGEGGQHHRHQNGGASSGGAPAAPAASGGSSPPS
jgi:multidrug efflux system membrane fusion protein